MQVDSIIQKLRFIVPASLIFLYVGYMFLTKDHMSPRKENDLAEQFNGKVDSMFRDSWGHNVEKVILSNHYVYSLPPDWENIIVVGDSLSKKKNSLKLEVYKQDKSILILDYYDTYKK